MARRRSTASVLSVAAAVVLIVVCGPALLAPTVEGTPVAATLCDGSRASAAGEARVGLVIDRGPAGDGVSVQCVSVPDRATGFDLLRAGGHSFRLNSAGLTCAIDGVPETGCGERTAGGYRYWAYFHARSGSWSYASDGPAVQRLGTGAVEGWHYVDGSGRPDDPPPAGPADAASICPPAPTTTVVGPTASTAPSLVPGGHDSGSASGSGGPGGADAAPAGSGSGDATTGGPDVAAAASPPATTIDGEAEATASDGQGTPADSAAGPTTVDRSDVASPEISTVSGIAADQGGSAAPWAALAVGLVIVGLGVVATVRLRVEREP